MAPGISEQAQVGNHAVPVLDTAGQPPDHSPHGAAGRDTCNMGSAQHQGAAHAHGTPCGTPPDRERLPSHEVTRGLSRGKKDTDQGARSSSRTRSRSPVAAVHVTAHFSSPAATPASSDHHQQVHAAQKTWATPLATSGPAAAPTTAAPVGSVCSSSRTWKLQQKLGTGVLDKSARQWQLYVSNVPFGATESELWQIFAPIGHILELYILRRPNGTSRGCGFVTYADRCGAECPSLFAARGFGDGMRQRAYSTSF